MESGKKSSGAAGATTLERARGHWLQAGESLALAEKMLAGGAALDCCFMSVQAASNALVALGLPTGRYVLPAHSPVALAEECLAALGQAGENEEKEGNPPLAGLTELEKLPEACRALEEVAGLSPFGLARDEKVEAALAPRALEGAARVLDMVGRFLAANAGRFFTP
ncbi:MAG: HEPN domain-containing protein [Deltaproteobacteria bacterium]|nr:HEPN domain-containing protein [Deltaproteobacteria bacterium]